MRYLVVDENGTDHLPVRDSDDGPLNHQLLGAAWAALHGGYRGNKYQGPDKEEAIAKLKALYQSEGMELPSNQDSDSPTEHTEKEKQKSSAISVSSVAKDRHVAVLLNGPGALVTTGGKTLHEIPIAIIGNWVKNGHRFSITPSDLRDIVKNFNKRKNDQVVIDYEHASEQPEIAKGGPIPAAGWIHELQLGSSQSAEGSDEPPATNYEVRALVEWTPEAECMIKSGQYRFFSPAIDWSVRDKETGQPQGATLTSGALTNHPFLEELPPIMLTDLSVIQSPWHFTDEQRTDESATRNQRSKGANMKKLSMKKLEGGEYQGHMGVFHGDDLLGYMPVDDFADLARQHLGVNPDAKVRQEKDEGLMSELLREAGVRGPASGVSVRDYTKDLLLRLSAMETRQREAEARTLLLTEAVRQGVVDNGKAGELARENKITLADYIAVQEAQKGVESAVQAGKILPRDRAFFFRDALERPQEFAEYVEGTTPVVHLGVRGIGSAENIPVDQEVDLGVKRLMSEQKISYGKALKQLFKDQPALEVRYRAAHSTSVTTDSPVPERAGAGITQ